MKAQDSFEKPSNKDSKASADCIRHLTGQLLVLTKENIEYKQEILKYQQEIKTLQELIHRKSQSPGNSIQKLSVQIKKIEKMNEILQKQIRDLQRSLEEEHSKNQSLINSIENLSSLKQQCVAAHPDPELLEKLKISEEKVAKLTYEKGKLREKNKELKKILREYEKASKSENQTRKLGLFQITEKSEKD